MSYTYKKKIICLHCKQEKEIWKSANSGYCSYECYTTSQKSTFINEWLDNKINGVYNTSNSLHRRVIKYFKENIHNCQICNMENKWNGRDLVFEIDHIDGNRSNNYFNNLRSICPNCHSQTDTFRAKNIKKVL